MPDLPAYFRMRQAAKLVGVESYVLRYWETEFAQWVRPGRSKTGQRVYSRRDVEALLEIRRLLHVELYTVKGARRQMAGKKGSER